MTFGLPKLGLRRSNTPGFLAARNENVSFTVGPLASPTSPRVDDTLYVVLEGGVPAPGAFTPVRQTFLTCCC